VAAVRRTELLPMPGLRLHAQPRAEPYPALPILDQRLDRTRNASEALGHGLATGLPAIPRRQDARATLGADPQPAVGSDHQIGYPVVRQAVAASLFVRDPHRNSGPRIESVQAAVGADPKGAVRARGDRLDRVAGERSRVARPVPVADDSRRAWIDASEAFGGARPQLAVRREGQGADRPARQPLNGRKPLESPLAGPQAMENAVERRHPDRAIRG